jgi:WhiB family redox-sensing transcriptional regulator
VSSQHQRLRAAERRAHRLPKPRFWALTTGPNVIPEIIGGDPIEICAQEPWMRQAVCLEIDPDLFYPDRGDSWGSRAAKRICTACPVREDCLQFAVAHHEHFGVWGGLTPTERQRMVRGAS